jgi:hypothetical protein
VNTAKGLLFVPLAKDHPVVADFQGQDASLETLGYQQRAIGHRVECDGVDFRVAAVLPFHIHGAPLFDVIRRLKVVNHLHRFALLLLDGAEAHRPVVVSLRGASTAETGNPDLNRSPGILTKSLIEGCRPAIDSCQPRAEPAYFVFVMTLINPRSVVVFQERGAPGIAPKVADIVLWGESRVLRVRDDSESIAKLASDLRKEKEVPVDLERLSVEWLERC